MSEPSTAPGNLQDEELQHLAIEWRMRAMQGDQLAHRLEAQPTNPSHVSLRPVSSMPR